MEFKEKLRRLRERADMTQIILAEKLGVTRRTVVYLESGERNPGGKLIKKIADCFGVAEGLLTDDNQFINPTKEEMFLEKARNEDNRNGRREARKYLAATRGMFAGGVLSEDDRDSLFEVLTEIYFDAKTKPVN